MFGNNLVRTCCIVLVIAILDVAVVWAVPPERIFVTNERDDSVSVIDGSTNAVVATIAIGQRPRGIGVSPDATEVYVAVSEDNAIAVFDPQTFEVLRTFESGDDPETFAVHPNGNIYISNEEDAKASVFNPKTGEKVAEIKVGIEPEGVAISPDGTKVIVTSESTNMLHVIAVPEHAIVNNILVGARPRAATFNHSGKLAYATSEISGEVKKVDIASGTVIAKMPLADDRAKPKDILLSTDGTKLYVAGGRANQIFILDEATLEILHTVPVGKRVWGLALSKDGTLLYTTDGVSNQVSVIDTVHFKVVATVPVGKFPWGIAVYP
jgi:PQQ-dependent catabolism-associated beta-propeller protein